ncbi:helix-turn-helix domain-containing protein [Bradyrhizobium japonicum]|uniref:helix-turn-helix domain-containing protein n=1 Tax=Bradyrhizobium japonicum TaxID=375 RepID=UPI0020464356|nr:helix-turn-helix domain-containing protein [Bradyrhizobium japonicum]
MGQRPEETPAQYLVLWAIMADASISAAAKCVAIALLLKFRNHQTGQCNPGFSALAAVVGRKRRSVIDALNELKGAGWIDWVGTKGGSPSNTNSFHFYLEPVQFSAPVQPGAPVQLSAQTGAAERTQPVQYTAHEPSIEPSEPSGMLRAKKGFRVKRDTPSGDRWQRYWHETSQPEPPYSRRTGEYLRPLPSQDPPAFGASS